MKGENTKKIFIQVYTEEEYDRLQDLIDKYGIDRGTNARHNNATLRRHLKKQEMCLLTIGQSGTISLSSHYEVLISDLNRALEDPILTLNLDRTAWFQNTITVRVSVLDDLLFNLNKDRAIERVKTLKINL